MDVLKTVEINGASYQIAKMDAKTGSWLLMLLMGKLIKIFSNEQPTSTAEIKQPVEEKTEEEKKKEQEAAAKASITMMLTGLDQDEYAKVQTAALKSCYKLEGKGIQLPVPILSSNGEFTIKELEYDIDSVLQLTTQSLYLNIGPFFTAGKLLNLA